MLLQFTTPITDSSIWEDLEIPTRLVTVPEHRQLSTYESTWKVAAFSFLFKLWNKWDAMRDGCLNICDKCCLMAKSGAWSCHLFLYSWQRRPQPSSYQRQAQTGLCRRLLYTCFVLLVEYITFSRYNMAVSNTRIVKVSIILSPWESYSTIGM